MSYIQTAFTTTHRSFLSSVLRISDQRRAADALLSRQVSGNKAIAVLSLPAGDSTNARVLAQIAFFTRPSEALSSHNYRYGASRRDLTSQSYPLSSTDTARSLLDARLYISGLVCLIGAGNQQKILRCCGPEKASGDHFQSEAARADLWTSDIPACSSSGLAPASLYLLLVPRTTIGHGGRLHSNF